MLLVVGVRHGPRGAARRHSPYCAKPSYAFARLRRLVPGVL